MTRAVDVPATGRRLQPATARVAISYLFAVADLVFVAFAVIGWATGDLAKLIDLVLFGASCAVGVVVALMLASANQSARRAARTGRPPARRRARTALALAVLRIPALAVAIYLVAANTTPRPDGSWHLLSGAPLLVFGFLEILAMVILAAVTVSAVRRLATR